MTLLTIPGGLVAAVRSALFTELGGAAEGIMAVVEQSDREDRPELFVELTRHDATRALLGTIGWRQSDPPVGVCVDLHAHRAALKAALDAAVLAADEELAEAEHVDTERARRGEPGKARSTACRAHALRELAGTARALGDGSWEDRS